MKFFLKILVRIYRRIKHWLKLRHEHKITLEGIIFILITFFIGFAAINTSTNLLYLIMSMMLSFFIVSGFLSTSTLRKIRLKRLVARHISAQEDTSVQIEVKNDKKRMASYSLRIIDYLEMDKPQALGVSYLFHISAQSSQIASYRVRFPRRGLYKLSRIKAVTRFPFGFFERSVSIRQPQEILVYPRIIDVKPVLEGAHMDLGEYETGRKGHGHSLYGLRDYTPTDSARYIHWKVSARTSKIMLREFEKEEKKKITLFLDNEVGESIPSEFHEEFEKAVIYTASLAKYLIDLEFQVQLVTGSGRVPFGLGLAHLYRILRALAIIQLQEKTREQKPALPTIDAGSTNVVIEYNKGAPSRRQPSYAQVIDVSKLKIPKLKT